MHLRRSPFSPPGSRAAAGGKNGYGKAIKSGRRVQATGRFYPPPPGPAFGPTATTGARGAAGSVCAGGQALTTRPRCSLTPAVAFRVSTTSFRFVPWSQLSAKVSPAHTKAVIIANGTTPSAAWRAERE